MSESGRPQHLRLIADPKADAAPRGSSVQGLLFPTPDRAALFFVNVAQISGSEFISLVETAHPTWVVDVRASPRFDFGRLTRQNVFALFAAQGCSYIDLGAKLKIETRQDARWNPVFLAEALSEHFRHQGTQFCGPVVLLFDDERLLLAADEKLPSALQPSPPTGWKTIVVREPRLRSSPEPREIHPSTPDATPDVSGEICIEAGAIDGKVLEQVRRLWRSNSDTLGFLPDGAFVEAAERRQIIAATRAGSLVGYVLYRESRGRAVIVHLCVDPAHRDHRVARRLVGELRTRTARLRGIALTCRKDFAANLLWPRLGFVATANRPARATGHSLTSWWLDHNHPTLFTTIEDGSNSDRLSVMMDHNVFLDLHGGPNVHCDPESRGLLADWMDDEIDLLVSDETLNEIDRQNHDGREALRLRSCAALYLRRSCDYKRFLELTDLVRDLFPTATTPAADSDIRHVARAVASGADVLVTRDEELLEASSELLQRFGLTVIRPSELVVRIDEVRREHLYQPIRVAGTNHRAQRLGSGTDEGRLMKAFQRSADGENEASFLRVLRGGLAAPHSIVLETISDPYGDLLGLSAIEKKDGRLVVSLLRHVRGDLATTIARHLVQRIVRSSIGEKLGGVEIQDRYVGMLMTNALIEAGFVQSQDSIWAKWNIFETLQIADVTQRLGPTLAPPRILNGIASNEELIGLEHMYKPLKFWDLSVPTYLVAIRPGWASQLFDEGLANELLFASSDLTLRTEWVYYRAAKPGGVCAPGRILWYVSDSGGFAGQRHLRAYSKIEQVVVGPPKDLYRRFRRLGIYAWRDVLKAADGRIDQNIMAIRFTDTELFRTPISWGKLTEMLKTHDITTQIQSPTIIPPEAFRDLYLAGVGA